MIPRLIAAACALLLLMGGAPARAQGNDDDDGDQPVVVEIQGDCAVSVSGRAEACRGLAYMAFPSNRRKDFTALTADGGWAFSGLEDKRTEDGVYTLLIDSILRPGLERAAATGQCVMQVEADGSTVRSLSCQARTDRAVLLLNASGVAHPGDDDDDDDDDRKPDTSHFG